MAFLLLFTNDQYSYTQNYVYNTHNCIKTTSQERGIVYINLKLNGVTCENGSSSELGKSYWLRSLGLNTEGPECWVADRGGILGFFSYFLLVRTASVFSGCGDGRERVAGVSEEAFRRANKHWWLWPGVGGPCTSVCRNNSE